MFGWTGPVILEKRFLNFVNIFTLFLLQSLKRSTFPLERWANDERMVNARWTNDERTQSERRLNAERKLVNDMWTLNDERTRNTNGEQTRAQCEWWTHGECTMNVLFGKSQKKELLNFIL